MTRLRLSPRARKDWVRAILLVGLAAAAAAGFTSRAPGNAPLGDPLQESKVYRRTLEVYGGAANVLATELREGFLDLWRGRTLALTLAALTLAAAGIVRLATEDRPPGPETDGRLPK
jgi:hypothetical protein